MNNNLKKLLQGETIVKHRNNNGDVIEYTMLFDDENSTDDEIKEYLKQFEIHFSSPYDCTGKPFTAFMKFKRLSIGIIVMHYISLDI